MRGPGLLILAAGIIVAKTGLTDIRGLFIAGLLFYVVSFKKLNPIWAIVLGGVLGVVLY